MADQRRPRITAPHLDPALFLKWRREAPNFRDAGAKRESWIASRAVEWATPLVADQELRACVAEVRRLEGDSIAEQLTEARRPMPPLDRSDAADAARLRWMLNGNGYFLEESGLCGHGPEDADDARREIDERMAEGQSTSEGG